MRVVILRGERNEQEKRICNIEKYLQKELNPVM